jgi:organic radical activating enzyme
MDNQLINLYIDRLLNELTETVKSKLLVETQLKYTEQINQNLQKEIEAIKSEYEDYKKKQENINKRRKTKEEVDTSEF